MRHLGALCLVTLTSCASAPVGHSINARSGDVHSIDEGWRSPRPPGPLLRSCAAGGAQQVVPVSVYSPIAHVQIAELSAANYGPPSPDPIRGTSWLFGYARGGEGGPVLLHLSSRGELQTYRVPFQPELAVVSGDRIRLLRPPTSEGPAVWTAIDVSEPDAPKVGPVSELPDLGPQEWALAFAAGERYALIVSRPIDPPGAPLRASRFRIASGRREADRPLGREDRIADAWCANAGCGLIVGVSGGGLLGLSFPAAGGVVEHEIVASGAWSPVIVPTAAGGLVVWEQSGERGLNARPIDALGAPTGAAFTVSIDASVKGLVPVRSGGGGAIAVRVSEGKAASWLLAAVDPAGRSIGPPRPLPLLGELFLSATGTPEGALFVGSTSDVSYDDAGGYGFHSWSASVSAWFEGSGAPVAPVKLLSTAGDGRGGFHGLPIVRGASAAAVLIPSGEAYPHETKLVSLRAPCGAEGL